MAHLCSYGVDEVSTSMTVTETAPEASTISPADPSSPTLDPATGLAGVIGTGDHKVIGRMFIGFSVLFGLVALVGGLLVSIDRIDGTFGNTILSAGTWNQVSTFQGTALVFLFLVPLLLGIAICVVPLQVGADGVAFPRAAAASFWGWMLGSGAFIAAYLINGGPGGGDFHGVGLWAASFAMLVTALLLATVCVVTTVFALRAEGMSLDRAPLFSWSMLVAGVVWILTLPVLVATLALIYVDHRYGQKSFGFSGPQMFTRISWSLRQPQLYAFATPLLGLAADIVPVGAATRQPRRRLTMGAIGAFGVLGFGAFLQTTIYPRATVQPVYGAMAVLAVLPVLVLLGGWAATIRSGRPRLISPLVFSVAAVLLLLLATLGGAAEAIERLDLQGTLFDLGQSNVALFATLTAALGGLYYWASKIVGRRLAPAIGLLAAAVMLLGTLLTGIPYAVSGAFGSGDEVRTGSEALNGVAVGGYVLVIAGVVLVIIAVLNSLAARPDTPADPWGGHTLEWSTESPPPLDNFAEPSVVRSAEPLLDPGNDTADGKKGEAR